MEKNVYTFIEKQTNDPIIEWKTCTISGQEFPIYQSDIEFYDKISPIFNGKKYSIPTPTLCPDERQRRRMMFRNERSLYKRKCDVTGKEIISTYSPDKPFKVFDQKYRWSDACNHMEYTVDMDFNKKFSEVFQGFNDNFPQLSLMVMENENASFTNYTLYAKNIYMSNDVMYSNNILYSSNIKNCNDCIDVEDCRLCDHCYQTIRGENCQNCFFCQNIQNCYNCIMCIDCINTKNCFFCVDLHDKEGYIHNKKATAEAIEEVKNAIKTGRIDEYTSAYTALQDKRIVKSLELVNCENCFGSVIYNSKNSRCYFNSYNNDNCNYGMVGDSNTNCYDVTICNPMCEFSYELMSGGEEKGCMGNIACGYDTNVYYSYLCMNSSDLFGCIGLRNKSYCIFNKQYTKEEYEQLVPKIIEHMQSTGERGEFFSANISHFGYNETVANEYYPITKEEALVRGYKRQDNMYDIRVPEGAKTLTGNQIPADIVTVNDDILKEVLICEVSGRPFRITQQELDFYRKHDLSLPHKHHDIRHAERMKKKSQRTLYLRTCNSCGIDMLSTYPQDSTYRVYCETCYSKEIYG